MKDCFFKLHIVGYHQMFCKGFLNIKVTKKYHPGEKLGLGFIPIDITIVKAPHIYKSINNTIIITFNV
jgi:predicted RNA binding protein YcfA (HicA-like mRNA interferase family)